MPVLTLDVGGPNEMDIECPLGGHASPRKVGDRGYSGSGSEFSQLRAELMVVPFVTVPLPWSQIATIRSLFALGKRVNCAGDVFNKPGTIVCSGTITDELDETGDRGVLNGTLFEVGAGLSYTPPPPPTGDEVSDGLYWWYDAQALVGLSDGDPMSTWPDESGNGRTATADASWAPAKPQYIASAINGHPAVRFQFVSGNGRAFTMPGAFSDSGGPTEAHLFIVCAVEATSPPYHLGSIGFGPSFPDTSGGSITDHFGSNVSRALGAIGVDPTVGFIYHAHAKAGQWEADVGLTNKLTSASNAPQWGGQKLGGWYSGGFYAYPFLGKIGEFKVYKGPLSGGAVTSQITALGTKWGVTP